MFKRFFRKIVAKIKARFGKKKKYRPVPNQPGPVKPMPPLHPVGFEGAPIKIVGNKTIVDGKILDVEVHSMSGFTKREKQFYLETLQLFLYVAQSVEFRTKFLDMQWRETRGYDNDELYQMFIGGEDSVERVTDFTFDMAYMIYGDRYNNDGTIGWTYLKDLKIRTSRYFLSRWMKQGAKGKATFAGHICHEYCHSLSDYGMVHNTHAGSFVYEVGYLMADMAEDVAVDGRKLTMIEDPRK